MIILALCDYIKAGDFKQLTNHRLSDTHAHRHKDTHVCVIPRGSATSELKILKKITKYLASTM